MTLRRRLQNLIGRCRAHRLLCAQAEQRIINLEERMAENDKKLRRLINVCIVLTCFVIMTGAFYLIYTCLLKTPDSEMFQLVDLVTILQQEKRLLQLKERALMRVAVKAPAEDAYDKITDHGDL